MKVQREKEDDKLGYDWELYNDLMCKDGRMRWRCDCCKKYQHPDHEMTRSIYYQFTDNDGPNFCGYQCMMKYRESNDMYRFTDENTVKDRRLKRDIEYNKRKWVIKNKAENVMERVSEKQKENILYAMRTQLPVEELTTTSE